MTNTQPSTADSLDPSALAALLDAQLERAVAADDDPEAGARRALARDLAAELAPEDLCGRLMAQQMAACHLAAMDCFALARSTAGAEDGGRGHELALRLAARMMALFARQAGLLDTRRARARREERAATREARLASETAYRAAEKQGNALADEMERMLTAVTKLDAAALDPESDLDEEELLELMAGSRAPP